MERNVRKMCCIKAAHSLHLITILKVIYLQNSFIFLFSLLVVLQLTPDNLNLYNFNFLLYLKCRGSFWYMQILSKNKDRPQM